MELDSARNLKTEIFRKVFRYDELTASSLEEDAVPRYAHPRALEAAATGGQFSAPEMSLAVGITTGDEEQGKNSVDYRIRILVRDRKLRDLPIIDRIRTQAKGEAVVTITGPVRKHAFPLDRARPLRIGCSIAHYRVTAGTLGAFVRTSRYDRAVLSNNHVLARVNQSVAGDPILQPGKADDGRDPADRAAVLLEFVPIALGPAGVNRVDCAVASVLPEVEIIPRELIAGAPVPRLSGSTSAVDIGLEVWKIGRTTVLTHGSVQTIEVDQLMVDMGSGGNRNLARFDGQFAVTSLGGGAFSKPGDSGSVIFNAMGDIVGLLFAGSPSGGDNGSGLTFANPIAPVLSALDAELI